MKDKQPLPEEAVIKEYPNVTLWLDGKQVRAQGNLILTNRRLVFLRQVAPSQKKLETLQQLSHEASTEKTIQFALSLHKKNFQIPLSSVICARLKLYSLLPFPQMYLSLNYKTSSNRVKTENFRFWQSPLKRLAMSEFPTLERVRAINKATIAHRAAMACKGDK